MMRIIDWIVAIVFALFSLVALLFMRIIAAIADWIGDVIVVTEAFRKELEK